MTMRPPLVTPYFPHFRADSLCSPGADTAALLDGTISAVCGGLSPLLRKDEEWPQCKECGNPLVPYIQINVSPACAGTPKAFQQAVPPLEPEGATFLQVLICSMTTDFGTCFEGWVNCITEGDSWLVRRVSFAADFHDLADAATHKSICERLEEDEDITVLPERVISEWTAGNPEAEHREGWLYAAEDQEWYAEHQPAEGLKLLGCPVRGKYYNYTSAPDGCTEGNAGAHESWRCLVQLGTREEDNPVYTTGNIFVHQCTLHPDVFEAVCSGTW
ncbi:hypothetical protein GY45DRAFT_1330162 [Cubamyces sp. BRFM 1775]|nr:hypothetical protein GY45DRAFT_1330162 [Cubamyces sp. BRFM 1775]